jgi:hypothetical protein
MFDPETKHRLVSHIQLNFRRAVALSIASISTIGIVSAAFAQNESASVESKLNDLRKSVAEATTPERTREILSDVLRLIDESISIDEYTLAIRIANLAVDAADKIGNAHVAAVCQGRKTEVLNIGKEAKRLTKQFEKLAKKPLDPGPNFDVGKFKCLGCGDWERGLVLLAKGNNAAWRASARTDLEYPADVDSQIAIGDDWAKLAGSEKGPGKLALALRARYWYRRALSQTTGANRAKVVGSLERLPIMYLGDLDEAEVKPGPWPMGKNGDVGTGKPIEVDGFKSPEGIGLHPPENGEATVKYKLGSQWNTFVADVAVNDFNEPFSGSLNFVVLGDGKELWKSPPITTRGAVISCKVNIKGVSTLQLKTQTGRAHGAHAVWLDPHLLK